MVSDPPAIPGPDDSAEAAHLHDALGALEISEADDPTHEETAALSKNVIAASRALDRKQGPGPKPKRLPHRIARVMHDLNDELYTVTTVADFVAAVIPDGQQHDDAVEIYEAGTRAAADVVRLKDAIEDNPSEARGSGKPRPSEKPSQPSQEG
jgi:hypothetical protein